MMDMFDLSVYTGLAVFCLIIAWTLLVRRGWLPATLVRIVRWPMNLLGRIPLLGTVIRFLRRHSLATALPAAIGAGLAMPWILAGSVLLVLGALVLTMFLGAAKLLPYQPGDDDEAETGLLANVVEEDAPYYDGQLGWDD